MNYSLIEIQLRRFIYLGHKHSIYVNPIHRTTFWKNEKDLYELNGIKIIANIIAKNKTKDINSIVPIILKIEQEKKLENYEYLMYLLAVCAKMNKNKYNKLVTDVYEALEIICTDGFKLLMFYRFCNTAAKILYEHGYVPKTSLGYGNGARKAFEKWYLDKNPLETLESIIRQKRFRGITHKAIMNTIHLRSKDPSHQMYILYIRFGMNKLEEVFGQKMRKKEESSKEQRCVYDCIQLMHRIDYEKDSKLISDAKWNILGKHFKLILPKMLQSTKVLISFVRHLPLRTLLDNTYCLHTHGLFKNLLGKQGCMEFISRFKDNIAVNESGIHPIDSYLEFLKYERYGAVISKINKTKQNNKMMFVTNKVEQKYSDNLELKMKDCEYKIKNCSTRSHKSHLYFIKPIPIPVKELQHFLSYDLVEKTLKNLKPTGRKLLIAYDNRTCMKSVNCQYMHVKFVKVLDAIVLLIQSIVYQEKLNKPIICALFDPEHRFKTIKINYQKKFTTKYFQNCLFDMSSKKHMDQTNRHIRPLSTINWAKKKKNIVDVFLFLGTNKMDFRGIRKTKANYEAFSNSKIKLIICCLNGKHSERENLSRDGILLITGFDKNTARIINLFINDTF